MDKDYSDIINLPHKQSMKRKRMPVLDRAVQFAPFAALSGFDAAIREKARLTDKKGELDDAAADELNRKIRIISEKREQMPEIEVEYFVEDDRKEGGSRVTYSGRIRRIDGVLGKLVFADGTEIEVCDILRIELL